MYDFFLVGIIIAVFVIICMRMFIQIINTQTQNLFIFCLDASFFTLFISTTMHIELSPSLFLRPQFHVMKFVIILHCNIVKSLYLNRETSFFSIVVDV